MLNEKNLLRRIKESYLKSKKIFNEHDRSVHWKKISDKKNFEDLNQLSNFRNNGLSRGHDDSLYYNNKKFIKEIEILSNKVNNCYIFKNI